MEYKLLELKDQFCRWYCQNKVRAKERCPNNMGYGTCPPIEQVFCCDEQCNMCMVSEYIRYIRDELK